jgi:hypothetical protein
MVTPVVTVTLCVDRIVIAPLAKVGVFAVFCHEPAMNSCQVEEAFQFPDCLDLKSPLVCANPETEIKTLKDSKNTLIPNSGFIHLQKYKNSPEYNPTECREIRSFPIEE